MYLNPYLLPSTIFVEISLHVVILMFSLPHFVLPLTCGSLFLQPNVSAPPGWTSHSSLYLLLSPCISVSTSLYTVSSEAASATSVNTKFYRASMPLTLPCKNMSDPLKGLKNHKCNVSSSFSVTPKRTKQTERMKLSD